MAQCKYSKIPWCAKLKLTRLLETRNHPYITNV
jgi:hypothetical protein